MRRTMACRRPLLLHRGHVAEVGRLHDAGAVQRRLGGDALGIERRRPRRPPPRRRPPPSPAESRRRGPRRTRPGGRPPLPARPAGAPRRPWRSPGRRRMATTPLTKAMAAATRNGMWAPPSAARAPMAGPATKPTPNAAPTRPISRARRSGGREVRHRGLGDRDRRPGHAVDDAAREQHPQRPGESGEQRADRRAEQRHEDDRLATDPVREAPPQRGAQQLGQRERRR